MATQTINYNNMPLRIISALVATFFITFHDRWTDFFEAFSYITFYLSFAVGFAIALLLIYLIHRSSVWLDSYYTWRVQPIERAAFQVLLGFFLPIIVDLLLISLMLAMYGENLVSSGFFEKDFIIVFLFILVVNLYYILHYFFASEAVVQEPEKLVFEHNFKMVTLDVEKEVVCFYKQGNLVMVVCNSGEEYALNLSLRNLQQQYEPKRFCRINKSVIVNVAMLRGYQGLLKKRNGVVLFKPEILPYVENRQLNLFLVTSANVNTLKSLL